MKKLALVIPFFLLAGCNSQQPLTVSTQQVVIMPDSQLFECPTVSRMPNPDTLTDAEVGKLLVQLQSYNIKCKKNVEAIRIFLTKAKETVEQN